MLWPPVTGPQRNIPRDVLSPAMNMAPNIPDILAEIREGLDRTRECLDDLQDLYEYGLTCPPGERAGLRVSQKGIAAQEIKAIRRNIIQLSQIEQMK